MEENTPIKSTEPNSTEQQKGAQKEQIQGSGEVQKNQQRGTQQRGYRKEQKRQFKPRGDAADSGFIEKVIKISRVSKVTKGGKKMSFSALVVVGDTKGRVGYSLGKANDVAGAIKKGLTVAKKTMVAVPLKGTTIPHEINGVCGGALVMLKPASDGTGVIASGPVRAVCDAVGIHNILTKCHRSNNPINVVKATVNGLTRLKTSRNIPEKQETQDAIA